MAGVFLFSLFDCTCSYLNEINTRSSTKYRSSSFVVKFQLMPVDGSFHYIVESKNRHPDIAEHCVTPVVIPNQSD
jgi:hypothetical protein